ncbi:MAG: peptide-methionine (R)-S-oxide reductase MsrB, partial [Saprospiraceae bacterium]|nr:peptide-methionine (R)-S-oxide reductase MsrB [Saprospiraceae bacterium]
MIRKQDNNYTIMRTLICLLAALFLFVGCNRAQSTAPRHSASAEKGPFIGLDGDTLAPIDKSVQEWKSELTDQEYRILREAGTERAFSGRFVDHKEKGVYTCAGCGLPLFDSKTKFKSGTGWPSYYQPTRDAHIEEKLDTSYGMRRIEVLCARCNGHLGHV